MTTNFLSIPKEVQLPFSLLFLKIIVDKKSKQKTSQRPINQSGNRINQKGPEWYSSMRSNNPGRNRHCSVMWARRWHHFTISTQRNSWLACTVQMITLPQKNFPCPKTMAAQITSQGEGRKWGKPQRTLSRSQRTNDACF